MQPRGGRRCHVDMWFDRTLLRASLLAGSAAGALVAVGLILEPAAAVDATTPPAPVRASCGTMLGDARRTLAQPGASDVAKVAAVEQLTRIASDRCRGDAAALTSELARAYHRRAVAEPAMREHAERLYDAYLAAFPDGTDAAENLYYRAELEWTRAEAEGNARIQRDLWEQAGAAFNAVVYANRVDAAKRKEAAYAAVLAWKNASDGGHPTGDAVPREIPSRERSLLAAYRNYRDIAGGDDAAQMTFLEGNLLRRYGHLDEALPLFLDILDHHRDHEVAEYAANLALDSYNLLGRHAEMIE